MTLRSLLLVSVDPVRLSLVARDRFNPRASATHVSAGTGRIAQAMTVVGGGGS